MTFMAGENDATLGLPIGEVERRTGLPKDTLRIWERRYGFPQPVRSARAVRLYPFDQVEKLTIIKALVDRGARPAGLVALPVDVLTGMLGQRPASPPASADELGGVAAFLVDHNVDALRRHLGRALARLGLRQFVLDIVAPATALVGESWANGEIAIYVEHVFTEQVSRMLRSAIASLPASEAGDDPRILLTTLPGEPHTIGLLMAEALMALEGAACLSLGAETPVPDIVAAVRAHRAHVVALSISGIRPAEEVARDVAALDHALPPSVGVWVGGGGSGAVETPRAQLIPRLDAVSDAVTAWRRGAPAIVLS